MRWLGAIGRSTEWKIPTVPIVCEKHFVHEEQLSARNLAPNVVPTLNLPSPEGEQLAQLSLKQVKSTKTSVKRKTKRTTKDRTIPEPEVVLVPTVVAIGNDCYESCCRFCSDELKVTGRLSVASLRQSGLVRDAIWDLCWPSESSIAEDDDFSICNVCWLKMQEFDHFVRICHQQQETLPRISGEKPVKDELVQDQPSESELSHSETGILFTEPQISNPEDVEHTSELRVEQSNSELPSLEGLTIDEMLEVLDKIPVPRKKYNQLNEDEECWDCGKMFPNRSQKKEHRKTCPAIGTAESLRHKSHACEICAKQFDSRHGYRMHLQKIHKNEAMGEENSEELKRLMSKKRLLCPLCPDRFEQLHMLKYHLKTHKIKLLGNVKPLRGKRDPNVIHNYCQLCDKTFQHPSYLKLHMKFHKRERDFQCDRCDKRFFISQDLKHHKMAVHETHTILCGECGKTFGTQRYFKRHMLSHSTDPSLRPHKCSYCPETFHSAAKLKDHMCRHTGEKIHQCELCDQAFRFRHQLTHHKISKHGMQLDRQLLVDTRQELAKEEPADSGENRMEFGD